MKTQRYNTQNDCHTFPTKSAISNNNVEGRQDRERGRSRADGRFAFRTDGNTVK